MDTLKINKQLCLNLLKYCEELFFERYLMEALLVGTKTNWKPLYDQFQHDPEMKAQVREQFASAYKLIELAEDDAALIALLQKLPTAGKPN
jgi:hypothetical protein